jgi:VWFA-related protein
MVRNRLFCLLLAAPLLLTTQVDSQQKSPAHSISQAPAGKAPISLNIVVTAKNGVPVSGLHQQDFKLLEDGAQQAITSFRAVTAKQAQVEVLLVVDSVNVPYTGVSYIRGQLERFLRANGGQLAFPTALVVLTDAGTQIQSGFSRDGNAEAEALEHTAIGLREDNRSAGFWGAAERFQDSIAALHELTAREATRPGRKFIVWASAGWPLLSGPGVMLDSKQQSQLFDDVVNLSTDIRRAGVTLYNVDPIGPAEGLDRTFYYRDFLKAVSKPGQVDAADLSVQVLAIHSGGLVLASSNSVVDELQKCIADGSAYYEVSFEGAPAERRDEYHAIDVKVAEPGLTARTLQGYYAQP